MVPQSGVIYRAPVDTQELFANWRLQAPGMAPLFGGSSWTSAAWQHLPELGVPCPLVYEDESGVTILPMSIVADGDRKRVVFAGGPMIDVGDALSSSSEPVRHTRFLLEQIRQQLLPGDWLDFRPIYTESLIARAMMRKDFMGFETHVQSAGVSPGLVLALRPAGRLKRKFATQLCQRSRKLTKHGGLIWRRHQNLGTADVSYFLERRREQWTKRRFSRLPWPQESPGFADFLKAVATSYCDSVACTFIDELVVGSRMIAQDLYLQCGSHRLLYMRWFDIDYSRYTPGHLLVQQSMRSENIENVTMLDFGRGNEEWKYYFGATDHDLAWLKLTAI